jgi:hypothetical protein
MAASRFRGGRMRSAGPVICGPSVPGRLGGRAVQIRRAAVPVVRRAPVLGVRRALAVLVLGVRKALMVRVLGGRGLPGLTMSGDLPAAVGARVPARPVQAFPVQAVLALAVLPVHALAVRALLVLAPIPVAAPSGG